MRAISEIQKDYDKICAEIGDWVAKKAVAETGINQGLQKVAELQKEHTEALQLQAELEKAKREEASKSSS